MRRRQSREAPLKFPSGMRGKGHLGARQAKILRFVRDGEWFACYVGDADYRACMRLESRGLLKRDGVLATHFRSTPAGVKLIEEHDAAP